MSKTNSEKKKLNIAVVGSGVSGISAAHYLLEKGYSVDLIEKFSTIGGRMGTAPLDDKMIAFGGKNIGVGAELFRDFIKKNGDLKFEYFGSSWTREINGKMVVFDNSNKLKVGLTFLKNFTLTDSIKFLKLFRSLKDVKNRYLDGPYFRKISKKHDKKSISNYFSKKFCDNFLRLLTVRMNGTEPENYHLGNFCSNLGMAKISKNMEQLEGNGMHQLLENFSQRERLNVMTDMDVKKISIKNDDRVEIEAVNGKSGKKYLYDGIILAQTANNAAEVLKDIDPVLGDELNKIVYNPVVLSVVKYKRPIFNAEQRAITFDKDKILSNAGCYGINDLNIVRYTFSGGEAQKVINENSDPEELISSGEKLLNRYFKVSEDERVGYVHKFLPEGLCSYAPFHYKIMDKVNDILNNYSIELTGDYVKGASLESCFKSSQEAVEKMHERLNGKM